MHSAWLEAESGEWYKTTYAAKVLNHDGRIIICNNKSDEDQIAEKVAAETGKFASRFYDRVTISDHPIFESLTEEAQRTAIAGTTCIIRRCDGFHTETIDGKDVKWHPEKPGFVTVGGSTYNHEMRYDLVMWQKCNRLKARRDRKAREDQRINQETLKSTANKLAESMGMGDIKEFRVEQFVVWVFAHDQFFGRRATNRYLIHLAKSWSKNPEAHKKHYKRWISETVLNKLEERFRSIVKSPKAE